MNDRFTSKNGAENDLAVARATLRHMSDNWLTVSQAAQHLGISERQARRYAAKLSPEDREDTPDNATRTLDAATDWQERAVEYKEQIQFLRATVEQHQRSEAELRAALRKALEIAPRQLTSGSEPPTPTASAPPETSNSVPQTTVAPVAPPKAPREPIKSQRRRAVRGLFRAFFGIDNGDD